MGESRMEILKTRKQQGETRKEKGEDTTLTINDGEEHRHLATPPPRRTHPHPRKKRLRVILGGYLHTLQIIGNTLVVGEKLRNGISECIGMVTTISNQLLIHP